MSADDRWPWAQRPIIPERGTPTRSWANTTGRRAAERVRALRMEAGLGIAELAESAGMPVPSVQAVEEAGRYNVPTLRRIIEALVPAEQVDAVIDDLSHRPEGAS